MDGLVPAISLRSLCLLKQGHRDKSGDDKDIRLEFDWVGTHDPSAVMSLPAALRYMNGLLPGGLPELRRLTGE